MMTTTLSRMKADTGMADAEATAWEEKPASRQAPSPVTTPNKEGIRLLEYARSVPVVDEGSLCKDLLSIFQENAACECIVMTSDLGGISGLAMRNRFSYKLAHRYSVALFYNKPALQLADREPIIVDADKTDPRELIDLA